MAERRIPVLVVMLLVAAALSPLHAGPRSGDLWIAVLVDDLLVPVGALVDGVWRVDTSDTGDGEGRGAMYERVGKRPILWPPAGRVLPTTWRAHMAAGRRKASVVDPIEEQEDWGHFGVRTDLGLPRRGPADATVTHGVAVAGDVTVRLFTPLAEGSRRESLMRFIDAPAVHAARAAIAIAAAAPSQEVPWRTVSDEAVASSSFHVEESSAVGLRDGSTLFYVEASKVPLDGCEVHVRATVTAPRRGPLRLLAIEGMTGCDNYVNLSPMAVVERGGAVCWVSKEIYEDGFSFLLRAPDLVPTSVSACTIK